MELDRHRHWQPRGIVFDLDGLLLDTEPIFQEAARRLRARRGQPVSQATLQAMMGMPARQALELFRSHHQLPESVPELAAESAQLFHEIHAETPAPLLPGARELLDWLESLGLPKGIATSSSARYVQRVLVPHISLERFAFVLTSEDVHIGKPHPEVYEKAAARLGIAPSTMLVLEDSPNGLRAAKAAGARCVVVPHALVPVDLVQTADLIVSNLAAPELRMLIEGHPPRE